MCYYNFSMRQCSALAAQTAPFLGQVIHVQESYVANPELNINVPEEGFPAPEGSAVLRLGFIYLFILNFMLHHMS